MKPMPIPMTRAVRHGPRRLARTALAAMLLAPVTGWTYPGGAGPGAWHEVTPGGAVVEVQRIAPPPQPAAGAMRDHEEDGVRLSVSRPIQGSTLHFSGQAIADHASRAIGLSAGPATVTIAGGRGAGLPFTGHAFRDVDDNLFHGYASREFDYSGGAIDVALPILGRLQAGAVSVSSPRVSDRNAYFLGFERGVVAASAFSVDRGGDTVGHGFDLSARFGDLHLGVRALRDVHGASWEQGTVTWLRSAHSSLGFALGRSGSRLYRDGEDTRAMLTFTTALGPSPGGALAVEEEPEEEAEQAASASRHRRLAILAGGAAVAAVALSSGDSNGDGVARYATQNEAAFNAMARINPRSVQENVEYGGSVYGNPDGTFSHAGEVKGDVASVAFDPHALVPSGGRALAAWHTHGGPDPRYVNEFFSPQDIVFFRGYGVDGYLGTPAGRMWLYDLGENNINQLVGEDGNEFILPN